ncbi:fibrinogen C domain-containing protein 1-like [Physella acuta]|uniref:fibrinogen C domain-containing protein 1-like n=1 Tax=Physella acuta TaxID=109671 RepID=UPI0027DC45D8|nr:fibrinogen C domain-containing protein 1-like [Physella acuta]
MPVVLLLLLPRDGQGQGERQCSTTFHVWQAGHDAQQMIKDVYLKIDNITAHTKFEIAEIKSQLAQETSRIYNWTYAVDKRVFQLQIDKMDEELVQVKNMASYYKMQTQVEQIGRRVDDLESWMYSVRNKLRSGRSSSGADENIPQQQGITTDMGAMLKNSVGDLKAEWILLKRELESVKKEGLVAIDGQRELRNETAKLKAGMEETATASRQMEMKVLTIVDQQSRVDNKINKLITDTDHIKFQMEQHKLEHRQQQVGMISLQSTTAALRKDLQDVTAKLTLINITRTADLLRQQGDGGYSHGGGRNREGGAGGTSKDGRTEQSIPRDCHDVYTSGYRVSSVYQILPEHSRFQVPVYCEMINNTGYTVIQRRIDGTLNFNRRWSEYKQGFGNPYGELWAGNELIHLLTRQKHYTLRLDMWDWEGIQYYAEYSKFFVEDESENYKLVVGEYKGTAGDSLIYHNKMAFSTEDVDNDLHERHCAAENKGGWWYSKCFLSQLNSLYHTAWYSQSQSRYADGVVWFTIKDSEFYSLKRVEMKLKPNYLPADN